MINMACPKLAFKFFGPYKVLQRVGEVAYRLDFTGVSTDSSYIYPNLSLSPLIIHQCFLIYHIMLICPKKGLCWRRH
jgi:hypothetical protein